MEKHIILNADDFGANDFIDNGIIKAIKAEKISSVSAFVTHDTSFERIEKLKANFPDLAIGLHFSITSGSPVNHKHSVLTDARSKDKVRFQEAMKYSFRPTVKKAQEISKELKRQLDKMKELLGSYDSIDHVTVHHGLTNFELKYFRKKVKILTKLNIPMRSLNSWSSSLAMVDDYDNNRFELAPILKEGIRLRMFNIDMLASKIKERFAKKRGLKYPDYLCDVIYGQPSAKQFKFLLSHFSGDIDDEEYSIEFMLHLGDWSSLSKEEKESQDTHGINSLYYKMREKELKTLLDYDLYSDLDKYNVEISSFRDLEYKN